MRDRYRRIGHKFKRFVRNRGYPKSLYLQKCAVNRADVCGGEGHTCAPDKAPEDFDQLIQEFSEKNGYDSEEIVELSSRWITDLEQDIPGDAAAE